MRNVRPSSQSVGTAGVGSGIAQRCVLVKPGHTVTAFPKQNMQRHRKGKQVNERGSDATA